MSERADIFPRKSAPYFLKQIRFGTEPRGCSSGDGDPKRGQISVLWIYQESLGQVLLTIRCQIAFVCLSVTATVCEHCARVHGRVK